MRNFHAAPPGRRASFVPPVPGPVPGSMFWMSAAVTVWLGLWWGAHAAVSVPRGRARYFTLLDALPTDPPTSRRRWNDRLAAAREPFGEVWGMLVVAPLVLVPVCADALPGGMSSDWWTDQASYHAFALLSGWAALDLWRATRDRWPVAAFGPPMLATEFIAAPDGKSNAKDAAPPMVAVPRPPPAAPPRDGYDRAGTAVQWSAGCLLAVLFTVLGRTSLTFWLSVVVLALWAANVAVRRWWRLPGAGEVRLTAVGVVRPGRQVAWEDADRVAVVPVPAGLAPSAAGAVAVEVLAGERADRFLVAAPAVGMLNELLSAVPPDRLVRADAAPAADLSTAAVRPPAGGLSLDLPSPRTPP